MGDEYDAHAGGAQVADDLQQLVPLLLAQCRSRLVKDQDLGLIDQRGADLNDALQGRVEVLHRPADVQLHIQLRQHLLRPACHGLLVQQPQRTLFLATDKDVLVGIEVRHQIDLLVDGVKPRRFALSGAFEAALCPVHKVPPEAGLIHAGNDLDEGGFARAVLADQRMDLSGTQVKINVREHPDPIELLADVLRLQEDLFFFHTIPHLLSFSYAAASCGRRRFQFFPITHHNVRFRTFI